MLTETKLAPEPSPGSQAETRHTQSQTLQHQTLRAYTLIHALTPSPHGDGWSGALILNIDLDPQGAALSLAANIAGAVCLTLDPDPARTRAALRTGACDFVVNTLDEALRAIKNEIRQRRPLSVGLEGQPAAILDEIIVRGVAPQLFTSASERPVQSARLAAFGTRLLDLRTPAKRETICGRLVESGAAVLETFVSHHLWTPETRAGTTPAELRTFDAQALALLRPEDHLRRNWLTCAPRLFPRDRTRTLWVTPAEVAGLTHPH